MPSLDERNAAFDAAKAVIMAEVPTMFHGYVHDDLVLRLTDAALKAAQRVREQRTLPREGRRDSL